MGRRFFISLFLGALLYPVHAGLADDAWYVPLISAFEEAGYISTSDVVPQAPAARWRFLNLLLRMKGGIVHGPFPSATFDDVISEDPHFFLFEEGAAQGWVRGAGNCQGEHPCYVYPGRAINRAEAAILLIRAFELPAKENAPTFSDVPEDAWYAEPLRLAAAHCIFRGDDARSTVRPNDVLNQVEMLAALARAPQGLVFPDCDTATRALPHAPDSIQIQLPLPSFSERTSSESSSTSSVSVIENIEEEQSGTSSLSFSSTNVISGTSSSSSLIAGSSDPEYIQFLSRHNTYIATLSAALSATQFSSDETALHMLDLLKDQMDMIVGYYQYVAIARQRILSIDEKQVAETLRLAIESAFENIADIQGS
ncbi:MAG: hypothetical protein ABIG34_02500 [Candidatus Peregrinibacteria bacterium]